MQEAAMAIPKVFRDNFTTLLRAATDGNLALLECTDAATGEPRYVTRRHIKSIGDKPPLVCASTYPGRDRERIGKTIRTLCKYTVRRVDASLISERSGVPA